MCLRAFDHSLSPPIISPPCGSAFHKDAPPTETSKAPTKIQQVNTHNLQQSTAQGKANHETHLILILILFIEAQSRIPTQKSTSSHFRCLPTPPTAFPRTPCLLRRFLLGLPKTHDRHQIAPQAEDGFHRPGQHD